MNTESTRVLKMLADNTAELSNEAYDALEAETRAALIAMFTRRQCVLGFSQDEARHNYATDERRLYLGTHECGDRTADDCDDIYVTLWAWMDGHDETDFVSWNLVTLDADIFPILGLPVLWRLPSEVFAMTFRVACVPPTTAHHAKRIVRIRGHFMLADSPALVAAKKTLAIWLTPFRPKAPLRGPVVLGVVFEWPWTSRHSKATRQGGRLPHIAPPDLSNVIKTLEDVLVQLQFLEDDRAVAVLHVEKWWSDRPGLTITLSPLTPTHEATYDPTLASTDSPATAAEFTARERQPDHRRRGAERRRVLWHHAGQLGPD